MNKVFIALAISAFIATTFGAPTVTYTRCYKEKKGIVEEGDAKGNAKRVLSEVISPIKTNKSKENSQSEIEKYTIKVKEAINKDESEAEEDYYYYDYAGESQEEGRNSKNRTILSSKEEVGGKSNAEGMAKKPNDKENKLKEEMQEYNKGKEIKPTVSNPKIKNDTIDKEEDYENDKDEETETFYEEMEEYNQKDKMEGDIKDTKTKAGTNDKKIEELKTNKHHEETEEYTYEDDEEMKGPETEQSHDETEEYTDEGEMEEGNNDKRVEAEQSQEEMEEYTDEHEMEEGDNEKRVEADQSQEEMEEYTDEHEMEEDEEEMEEGTDKEETEEGTDDEEMEEATDEEETEESVNDSQMYYKGSDDQGIEAEKSLDESEEYTDEDEMEEETDDGKLENEEDYYEGTDEREMKDDDDEMEEDTDDDETEEELNVKETTEEMNSDYEEEYDSMTENGEESYSDNEEQEYSDTEGGDTEEYSDKQDSIQDDYSKNLKNMPDTTTHKGKNHSTMKEVVDVRRSKIKGNQKLIYDENKEKFIEAIMGGKKDKTDDFKAGETNRQESKKNIGKQGVHTDKESHAHTTPRVFAKSPTKGKLKDKASNQASHSAPAFVMSMVDDIKPVSSKESIIDDEKMEANQSATGVPLEAATKEATPTITTIDDDEWWDMMVTKSFNGFEREVEERRNQ